MDKVFVIQKLSKSLEFIDGRVIWIRSAIDGIKRAEGDVKCYPDQRHAYEKIKDIIAGVNKVLSKAEITDDAQSDAKNAIRDLERYEKLCDSTRTKILRLQDGIKMHDSGIKIGKRCKEQLKKQYEIIANMTGCTTPVNSHAIEILHQFLTGEFSVYKNFAIADTPVKIVTNETGRDYYYPTFGSGECKWYYPIIDFSPRKKQFNIKIACITFATSGKSLNMCIEMFKVGGDECIYDADASSFKNPNRYESTVLTKINPFPGDRFIARAFTELGPIIDEDKRTVVTFTQQVRSFIIRTIDELIELEVPEFTEQCFKIPPFKGGIFF